MTLPNVSHTQPIPPLTAGTRVWTETLLGPLEIFPDRAGFGAVLRVTLGALSAGPVALWLELLRSTLEHNPIGLQWAQIARAKRIEEAARACDAIEEPIAQLCASTVASIVLLWRARAQLAALSDEELSQGVVEIGDAGREASPHVPEAQEARIRFATLAREHLRRRHLPDPDQGGE